ncbi:hypothetical protein BOTBODRAFT_212508 [Botryobasidium botryosum FD-172 SS1]|uniref:Uncharacterized protein n=1 Tax=Botryobasidium botryosum (strain FD-172 SS1) TaxID=930990 RepID=A0A067N1L2_BOTB1|nr:hypothetical protein BOTBODRAFT_212508 [Botryobasidium botryosum FD-172 SS1]
MKTPPSPAVTLRLSSHSFLDTILTDTHTPVYSIETDRATTVLCRCTPHGLARLATVNWPEGLVRGKGKAREAVPTVDFDGRTLSAREILRPASIPCPLVVHAIFTLSSEAYPLCRRSTHKFRAAGHPHSFKWYKSHGVWQVRLLPFSPSFTIFIDPDIIIRPLISASRVLAPSSLFSIHAILPRPSASTSTPLPPSTKKHTLTSTARTPPTRSSSICSCSPLCFSSPPQMPGAG